MAVAGDGNLHIYCINVGQGDTTVIISPKGTVTIIDAYRSGKLVNLLNDLGNDGNIENLVITHPHSDHFSGANRLAVENKIKRAILSPYWHSGGMGPPTYRAMVNRLVDMRAHITFLSGYSRWMPDDIFEPVVGNADPVIDNSKMFFEFLGPTNSMIKNAESAGNYNVNHLTIITRVSFDNFKMVIAGDAQMENWHAFDSERLMEDSCQVLRTAHHGSSNGTQWERIDRLSPRYVIVSSNPHGTHRLPDLASTGVFTKFHHRNQTQSALMTNDTGTIHIKNTGSSRAQLASFGDDSTTNIELNNSRAITHSTHPTNWIQLLQARIDDI